jgi:hypothetical protein
MYSVFKALKYNYDIEFLNKIGKKMNEIKDGIYTGIRKANDGIAIEVSKSHLWQEQQNETILFINLFQKQILQLKKMKYDIFIDMAIDYDDICKQQYGLFVHYSEDLLKTLTKNGIEYEISIYKSGQNRT